MPVKRPSPTITDIDDSRSSTPPSDYRAFPQSDSPRQWEEEDDDDGEKLWEVEAVVNEEIDIFYKRSYQIHWADWQRADGTSTTWEYALDGNQNLLSTWRKHAKKQRKLAAQASTDINMHRISSSLPHDIHTAESAEAFEEKLQLWKERSHNGQSDATDWNDEVEQLKKQRTARVNEIAQGKKRTRHGEVIATVPRTDQASQSVMPTAPATTLKKVKAQISPATQAPRSPSSSKRWPPMSEILEKRWNEEAAKVGAAEIRIVNEVDDEEHPPISDDFLYLESSRTYDEDVMPPESYIDFLMGCNCEERCNSNGLACECQADSQCNDSADMPTLAYDRNGLFLFTDHGEVVECNERCSCGEACGNRVAQKPRDFPIEIFKTAKLGWGVRTGTDIPEGKVLGLYTGRVMTRKKAGKLSREAQAYTFALDLRDGDPEFEERYTIGAHDAGNWTRFVNHSCDPSAKIYNVLFDTVRQANMPNIAYVAVKTIPAGSEITIDYDPAATLAAILGKGKGKAAKGRTRCLCGSERCRGWL